MFDQTYNRRGTYCTQWDYVQDRFGVEGLLPFTISDTDFPLPEAVTQKLAQRLKHPIFGYTRWNHSDFQQSVQTWYRERLKSTINPEWLVYSPSVIYSVSKLIEMKSAVGEGVVVQTPAYDAFYRVVGDNQRRVVENPLIYEGGYYRIDFADLELKLAQKDNKILLFCSPHNPTGRVWTKEELIKVVDLCTKYNVFLISDEIHMDVLRAGQRHLPIINFTQKNIALVTSASKTFNFPGLIFSYLMLPEVELKEQFIEILKYKEGLSSTSTLGLTATMSAYHNCSDWVDELNRYIDGNFEFAREKLATLLPEIYVVPSEATYLMWLDVSNFTLSPEEIQKRLIHIGKVAIMDGAVYGGNGAQFLRLNIGCPQSKLEDGVERMIKSLQ